MIVREIEAKTILSKSQVFDYALIDRYNYHYADRTYREHGMARAMREEFYLEKGEQLRDAFEQAGIPCQNLR